MNDLRVASVLHCLAWVFTAVILIGCASNMSQEDKWLWNNSTNAPPPGLK